MERLQKFLAQNGIASRRKCEQYIQQGKVQVNGKVVTELGTKINPKKVQVKFENKEIWRILSWNVTLLDYNLLFLGLLF